ncbi:MAG TPA: VanZ family protein [Bacteroidales bacterium]|nr:VanZ family protein [Bacteroidales bacterium]
MRRIWRNHWKSIIWAIFILVLCSIPGNQINKVKIIDIPQFDKFVHFFFYFVFTLLLISENNKLKLQKNVTVDAILIAASISLGYGGIIEIMQKELFINRGADIWDMVANTIGFLVAAISYRSVNKVTDRYI